MTYYKVLMDGKACHGGSAKYSLPRDGQPGDWMPPVVGLLVPCENGYHVCASEQLVEWLGAEIYECEIGDEFVVEQNKVVARCIRLIRKLETWNEKTARLFAADCAEHVLHLFEREHPGDLRPRRAIQAARDYANGVIDYAARAAARAAASAAAWDAARAAAKSAARDAASAAAKSAWDAAWDAARDAASAAASAAAWDAAWAAASAAAWAAARAVERAWQTKRLFEYLEGAK